MSIANKVALITGCSSGIGLALTQRLAEEDCTIYATTRNLEKAKYLKQLAGQFPQHIRLIQLDVTDSEEKIINTIQHIGKIDILINNAGIGLYGPFETATDAENRQIFETNVFGVLKITNAVLPGMRAQNSGTIITLSSVVGPLPDPYQPAYSASKAAIESYMAVLRKNMQDAGYAIVVANVHPGPVVTSFQSSTPNGTRFANSHNPYPQMAADRKIWDGIMEQGRPVAETVNTILNVLQQTSPNYWNPTEVTVSQQFTNVYNDLSGNNYMVGLDKK